MVNMVHYLSLQGKDLATSEQETIPPPSCIIQPGTGPAPFQYSNNNNIVDKRWTMPDEHCVESREETPVSTHIQIHVQLSVILTICPIL